MKYLLATARSAERINSIHNLPEETIIITNQKDFDANYETIYSEGEGFWQSLNDVIEDFDYGEPFVWLADDIKPHEDWVWRANEFYEEHCPDGLGLVVLNDLNLMHGGAAFAIITKEWLYVLFGEPKFPDDFAHNFLDTVIADRSKELERYFFCEDAIVEHLHYAIGKSEPDEVYEMNLARAKENGDKKVKDRFDKEWVVATAEQRLHERENKTAYFVLGSEGSGTHMMRNALVAAGCHWEQWYEEVDEDKLEFDGVPSSLVIRRSLPHAHKWPDLARIHVELEDAGYTVFVIFTIRDFNASALSVVARGYNQEVENCYVNQFELIPYLGNYLAEFVMPHNFVYSTYEAFVGSEGFRRWLFEERLGLPFPKDFEVYDGNGKYY